MILYKPENLDLWKKFSKIFALNCVRNTSLEDLHAGIFPSSKLGDYSDVKVVTPYGEIPWNSLGRISDEEMKILMKETVNKIYTLLLIYLDEIEALKNMRYPKGWDEPELDEGLILAAYGSSSSPKKRKRRASR